MKKRILIDGYNLALEQGTGVSTYARNLSYNLGELGYEVDVLYGTRSSPSREPLIREIAFFDPHVGRLPNWIRHIQNYQRAARAVLGSQPAHQVPITGAVITDTFRSRMPHYDRILNVPNLFNDAARYYNMFKGLYRVRVPTTHDIVHWTYPLPIRVKHAKNIYTLHDLVPLRLPYTTLDVKRRYYRMLKLIVRKADHIVTVSENSRQDIIDLLNVPPEKVTNTYQSVEIPDKYLNKPEEQVSQEISGTFGLDYKGYYLFYGAIEPKKNIGRIIEGYLASGVKGPLVLAGKNAWKSEEELRLLFDDHIRSLVQIDGVTRVKRKVIRLDYVPFPLLVSLIRGAKAVLFPSLYEGFGLPVLEAMNCSTPVITTNRSSVPEVADDAAIMVDPYDTRQLSEAITRLDADIDLRANLINRGLLQVEKFSAENYKIRLAKLYESI
jgi:glycosyltransferase involved in cell wall biosynthesis